MTFLSSFLRNQAQLILGKKHHAFLHAVFLAVIPYTDWLSVAVIALITLRKGIREGSQLLLAAMSAYLVLTSLSAPISLGVVNTLLTFIPGFIAAIALRVSRSWRWVGIVCLLQVLIIAMCLQAFIPEFITAQFQYIQEALKQLNNDSFVINLMMDKGLNQIALANYLIGIQAVGILLSGISALMLARSLQAQLFYPGGFKKEMENFRGDRIGLVLLVISLLAAHNGNVLAMNVLPVVMFYFLLAGLSLGSHILYNKRPFTTLLLLSLPLALLPFIMLPVYVIFGSLDSIFNFRNYLPVNADNRV